jgi:hypothetical protein
VTVPRRSVLPWTLVAASVLLIATILYLLFTAYLPLARRTRGLEAELHGLYAREAELHARLERELRDGRVREQQLAAARTERDALARRVKELERQLAERGPRQPRR